MKAKGVIIIGLLCIVIGALLYRVTFPCSENEVIWTDTIYVSTVQYDTIIQIKPVPVRIVEYKSIIDTVWLAIDVDTAAIMADYLRIKFYDDTLKDDSTGYIRLTESVTRNEIFDRTLYFEARSSDKIVTKTISPKGLYLISGLGASKQGVAFSGGLIYLNGKQRLYGAEIGYMGIPYVQLKYGFKF